MRGSQPDAGFGLDLFVDVFSRVVLAVQEVFGFVNPQQSKKRKKAAKGR